MPADEASKVLNRLAELKQIIRPVGIQQGFNATGQDHSVLFNSASSAEFVGAFRLGEVAEIV